MARREAVIGHGAGDAVVVLGVALIFVAMTTMVGCGDNKNDNCIFSNNDNVVNDNLCIDNHTTPSRTSSPAADTTPSANGSRPTPSPPPAT